MGKGKGFLGQSCIYCGRLSTRQGDHLFARALVSENERQSLPKVPCCDLCNGKKSELESELVGWIHFGDRRENPQTDWQMIKRRLQSNQRVLRKASEESFYVRDPFETGEETIAIGCDGDVLLRYASWVAKGTLFLSGQDRRDEDTAQHTFMPSLGSDELLFQSLFSMRGIWTQGKFGDNAVEFDGLTSTSDEFISVWRFVFFGGLAFGGENEVITSSVWSLFAPPSSIDKLIAMDRSSN